MLSTQNARILYKITLFLNIIEQRYKNEAQENSTGSITGADVEPLLFCLPGCIANY